MKTNLMKAVFTVLLPVFFVMLILQGCKKESDPNVSDQPGDFMLKGSVIDAVTGTGIAGATVWFEGQAALATDANGVYRMDCIKAGYGSFDVIVKADGYGYGFTSAAISKDAAMVNTIFLAPLSATVPVGPAGRVIPAGDPEGIVPGTVTSLTIPDGAFSGTVNVAFTRFTGVEVPGYAPAGNLNMGTVDIDLSGATPSKSMELQFAMPFSDPAVNTLPLLKFNVQRYSWENTGVAATIDQASHTATVQINSAGTYSLAIPGNFSETTGASGNSTTVDLDKALSAVDFTFQAVNDYPGGVPATISAVYLRNLASQNTLVNGSRTSFTAPTTLTFSYIGSKPDSVASVKSTHTGFYRWYPRVSYAVSDMPMSVTIHGATVNGTIRKQVYSPASGYQYVHDQGGGGK